MTQNPPYIGVYGTLGKVLDKIKTAAVPERFTQDFLATKLGFKGGGPKAVIPLLKKISFLASDGSPTELYRRFRNPDQGGIAMAEAVRGAYGPLYEMNEYLHDLTDSEFRNLVVEATGSNPESSTVNAIVGTFKTLKERADFSRKSEAPPPPIALPERSSAAESSAPPREADGVGLNLSYTINLNLPSTSDVAVFDAIFKSLREHLLKS